MEDLLSGFGEKKQPVSSVGKSGERKRKLGIPSSARKHQEIGFKREIDPTEKHATDIPSSPPPDDGGDEGVMPIGGEINNDDVPIGEFSSKETPSANKSEIMKAMQFNEDDDDEDDDFDIPMKDLDSTEVNKPAPTPVNTNLQSALEDSAKEFPDKKPATTTATKIPPSKEVEEEDHSELLHYDGPDIAQDENANENVSASFAEIEKQSDNSFHFFWMDYYESKGRFILIGKVKKTDAEKYVSCTLIVEGGKKPLYFLSHPDADKKAVEEEVTGLLKGENYPVDQSKDFSWVKKKYCFELGDVPKKEMAYLQVNVPFKETSPLIKHDSGEKFTHVFGRDTSYFEHFVLSKKIMGPSWLKISNAKGIDNASWSKVDCRVFNADTDIELIPEQEAPAAPPMDMMSLSVRTVFNSKTDRQEIWAISCRMFKDVKHDTSALVEQLKSVVYTDVRAVGGSYPPGFKRNLKNPNYTTLHDNESALLASFLTRIRTFDPDVIIGHDLEGRHLNLIAHALKHHNTQRWSSISRLRQINFPKYFGGHNERNDIRNIMKGRLLCDLNNDMGQSLTTKCDTWELTEMCDRYIQTKRLDYDIATGEKLVKGLLSTGEGLASYIDHNERDTYFMVSLALRIQILALSKQLTNLAGNSWARTLAGSRVDRNEYILLHEFTNQGYLVPDKAKNSGYNGNKNKKKEGYTGGKVLDPKKGLHQNIILVMDFNSLYPSIIQEFNVCFTTVDRDSQNQETEDENNSNEDPETSLLPQTPSVDKQLGILPRLIKSLVEKRREVKKLMKDGKAEAWRQAQWDIKQQSYKLTANSMYGCLGFPQSRFYALPLARLTTYKGREALTRTQELVEDSGYNVIYGDTDSIMVDTKMTDFDKAMEVGKELRKVVNDQYRELEIDIDNIFQRMLLLGKKKYAALVMTPTKDGIDTKMEIKGLDMVRRGFCDLAKDTSRYVLDKVLHESDFEAAESSILEHLENLVATMRSGDVKMPKYLIRTRLGKDPSAYSQSQISTPVAIALRRRQKGDLISKGDVIQYVVTGISESGEKGLGERSFTIAELKEDPNNRKPDVDYYLNNQIEPTVKRLLEPVEAFDVVKILDALGLESRKKELLQQQEQEHKQRDVDYGIQPLDSLRTDRERFKFCDALVLSCGNCGETNAFSGLRLDGYKDQITASGIQCVSCKSSIPMTRLNVQLEVTIRNWIKQYYLGKVKCNDPACELETRQIGVYGRKCRGQDDDCQGVVRFVYDDEKLYTQLLYLDSLFDMDRAKKNAVDDKDNGLEDPEEYLPFETVRALAEQNRERFEVPRKVVNKYLSDDGRRYVDLHSIFSFMI